MQELKKSPNIISTIGLKPSIASPPDSPTIEASLIGVAIICFGNLFLIFLVILKAPPYGSNIFSQKYNLFILFSYFDKIMID